MSWWSSWGWIAAAIAVASIGHAFFLAAYMSVFHPPRRRRGGRMRRRT